VAGCCRAQNIRYISFEISDAFASAVETESHKELKEKRNISSGQSFASVTTTVALCYCIYFKGGERECVCVCV